MRLQHICLFPVACLLLIGCRGSDGPQLAKATGTVTYKGKPVAGAVVSFIVAKAPLATGTTDAEGKFTLTTGGKPGVALGEATVGIVKHVAPADDMTKMTPADMAKMAEQSKMTTTKIKDEIPARYSVPETSTLVATVVADESKNVFEFNLAD